MNRKFSVISLLYGSLGLQTLTDTGRNPHDIDICVPRHSYHRDERWEDMLSFMQSEGYELTDLHEYFFRKDEIEVNFGVIDGFVPDTIPSIESFCGIDPADIPIIQTDGVCTNG